MLGWEDVHQGAMDSLTEIDTILIVEVSQFSDQIDAFNINNVVVSSVGKSNAFMHGLELVSSHLGCLVLALVLTLSLSKWSKSTTVVVCVVFCVAKPHFA
jgi:hypothetical protein